MRDEGGLKQAVVLATEITMRGGAEAGRYPDHGEGRGAREAGRGCLTVCDVPTAA